MLPRACASFSLRYVCLLAGLLGITTAARDGLCPPLGPVLPAPRAPTQSLHVQAAASVLQQALLNITASLNNSALSFGVQSIHESNPILEFHYTPPNFGSHGVKQVNSDTVYRLASTSKLFPVLAVLQTVGMDLNDPITKYLPELRELNDEALEKNQVWAVDWDEVTLGALSSHLGIPADCEAPPYQAMMYH